MRLFSKQNSEPRIFKSRSIKFPKYYNNTFKLSFLKKKIYFFVSREFRFEIIHFGLLKRALKRLSKKNKISKIFKKKNVWVFWKPNYPLTKKSKNSRMGKGKGAFLRWSFRIPAHFNIFQIIEVTDIYRASKMLNYFRFKFTPSMYFKHF